LFSEHGQKDIGICLEQDRGTGFYCLHPVLLLLCKEDAVHCSIYTSIGDHTETRQDTIQPLETKLLQFIPHLTVAHWVVLSHKRKA